MLAAILQAHGLKTGLYISPHYKDFRERIKIDGQFISPGEVVKFVEKHKDIIQTVQPSFFEITVAMAFDHFARHQVDVAVIETGLGGRLDSTNVIRPLVSVITNIGYDHMDLLGDTLPKIAFEKAGIIKSSVPAVIGEEHSETRPVFEQKARQEKAPIFWASQNYSAQAVAADALYTRYNVYEAGQLKYKDLLVGAGGPFQARNVCTVLQAFAVLKFAWQEVAWSEENMREGLKNLQMSTYFIGRWQQLGERPLVICDSAHNQDGFEAIMDRLLSLPHRQLHIVTGFSADKEVGKLLAYFPNDAIYYFAKANVPRGMDAAILREKAGELGLKGRAYSSVRKALQAARRKAQPDDVIFVGGSIFVVGEVI
jgi:dihydrofolate synthase/folylpolyglutamate synthase